MVETIGSALIYGTSFDGVSHLLTINSQLQLQGKTEERQEEEEEEEDPQR